MKKPTLQKTAVSVFIVAEAISVILDAECSIQRYRPDILIKTEVFF